MKRFIAALLCVLLALSMSLSAFAAGDPNIDTGGGGLGNGSAGNVWYGDSGVRVSIVNADTKTVAATPVDYIKEPRYVLSWYESTLVHFGKTCKLRYNAGAGLSPTVGGYTYKVPQQALPKIIATNSGTGNITAIRNYFTDEQVLKAICADCGFNYDTLLEGKYRLVIEPLASFLYDGLPFVMTATEAALYDRQVSGKLRTWMGSLTHKNMPLALYLETSDLGYSAWTGSKSSKASNEDIIANLGIGIVRFSEPEEPDLTEYDYEYRVNTEVITAVEVSGGQSDPDNPVTVSFTIQGSTYNVGNVFYPDGDSQLAWVKWHTPSEPCEILIRVNVSGGGHAQGTVSCKIVDLDGHDPPNPVADDRNDSFRPGTVPNNAEAYSASWGVWSPWWQEYWVWIPVWEQCWHSSSYTDSDGNVQYDEWYHWVDNGYWEDQGWWEFDYNSYYANLTASMTITPDSLSPSASGSMLKSGYGIQESVTARIATNQSTAVTAAQNAVTYFPEFKYETYWRLLLPSVSGKNSTFRFKDNPYSTYSRPTHFTPIWYPDGSYTPYTWLLDCWTPAGMLSANLTDTVSIRGNLWEEWHIAPTK